MNTAVQNYCHPMSIVQVGSPGSCPNLKHLQTLAKKNINTRNRTFRPLLNSLPLNKITDFQSKSEFLIHFCFKNRFLNQVLKSEVHRPSNTQNYAYGIDSVSKLCYSHFLNIIY